MSSSNCRFLACIQVSQETGKMAWYSHLFKNFPQFVVIHIVKSFNTVNETEVDGFFWNSLVFSMIQQMLVILISHSSTFFESNLYIWKFLVHTLLKPHLKDFVHYLASMWNKLNCAVVWTFFGIALIWVWNEKWPFLVLCHCWIFQICWQIECHIIHYFSSRKPHL